MAFFGSSINPSLLNLNLGLPQIPASSIQEPKSNIDINAALGLKSSPYEGLQTVGNTGYYYGNNRMYEPYKITSSLAQNSDPLRAQWSYVQLPTGQTVVSNYHPEYGGPSPYVSNRAEGTIEIGDQAFRPISSDITGFNKTQVGDTEVYEYSPSMAYISAMNPKYTPSASLGLTGVNPNSLLSNISTGGYGAGQYLGNNSLLGLNFSAPQVAATGE